MRAIRMVLAASVALLICILALALVAEVHAQGQQQQQQQRNRNQTGAVRAGGSNNVQANAARNNRNFCKASKLPRCDGSQKKTGCCSDTVQGVIPASAKMCSTVIVSPQYGAKLPRGKAVEFVLRTTNLELGFFEDPKTRYNLSPQTLNGNQVVKGHQHVVVQQLPADINQNSRPPPATKFAFFKGLEKASQAGELRETLSADGFKQPGQYRICTMAGSSSHQAPIMPVAQRGSCDDCIRVQVV